MYALHQSMYMYFLALYPGLLSQLFRSRGPSQLLSQPWKEATHVFSTAAKKSCEERPGYKASTSNRTIKAHHDSWPISTTVSVPEQTRQGLPLGLPHKLTPDTDPGELEELVGQDQRARDPRLISPGRLGSVVIQKRVNKN